MSELLVYSSPVLKKFRIYLNIFGSMSSKNNCFGLCIFSLLLK
ncbi:MAG: hypothetical protein Satyrvirus39_4 [Satyrvirus sp.]|uniref:Uncharacterized protein n=1 Tax=Satyrvirus sp. TaxID=2487771 RepID=A0A3G5AEX7_9VIRU|nr:MAG: hypothetical protein Satyrvirus39_4 [Satyrvirus sp.]